jgi:hypothetical protein
VRRDQALGIELRCGLFPLVRPGVPNASRSRSRDSRYFKKLMPRYRQVWQWLRSTEQSWRLAFFLTPTVPSREEANRLEE